MTTEKPKELTDDEKFAKEQHCFWCNEKGHYGILCKKRPKNIVDAYAQGRKDEWEDKKKMLTNIKNGTFHTKNDGTPWHEENRKCILCRAMQEIIIKAIAEVDKQ